MVMVVAFLFSLLSLLLSSTRKHKHKLPPGPVNLPLIGNLHRFGELPHRSLYKLSRKHGPLMYLKLGTVPLIVASSAEMAKEFLKTHDLQCCSRPLLTSLDKLSYGFSDIAFAPYGEQWRELRKICMVHFFSTKKVASFRSIREEEVSKMISSISSSSQYSKIINLSEELLTLVNNVTCRSAHGRGYGTEGTKLHRMLGETQAMLNGFFFADYTPMLGWLDVFTGMRARLKRNFHELDGFYQQVIDEHLEDGEKDALIDALIDMKKATRLTDDHIKGALMVSVIPIL